MDTLTSLFTAIGDSLTGASWFDMVKWPFLILVALIALGGAYTVRFNSNSTLLCLGIQGALKLTLIYMATLVCHLWIPSFMLTLKQLPFMSITESSLRLFNPLDILDGLFSSLQSEFVRLYFLLLMINLTTLLDYRGKNFLTWLFLQIASCGLTVGAYAFLSWAIRTALGVFIAPVTKATFIILIIFGIGVVIWKYVLLLLRKQDDPTFTFLYGILVKHPVGRCISTAYFSLLIVSVFLCILNMTGNAALKLAELNLAGFAIIGFLCTMTLYVFNMYYCKRT